MRFFRVFHSPFQLSAFSENRWIGERVDYSVAVGARSRQESQSRIEIHHCASWRKDAASCINKLGNDAYYSHGRDED